MNFITRYKRQNTKGFKGVRKIFIEEKCNLKWKLQYLYYKYIYYKFIF